MKYLNVTQQDIVEHPHLRTLMWMDHDSKVWCQDSIHGFYAVPDTHPNILFIVALVSETRWFDISDPVPYVSPVRIFTL